MSALYRLWVFYFSWCFIPADHPECLFEINNISTLKLSVKRFAICYAKKKTTTNNFNYLKCKNVAKGIISDGMETPIHSVR